MAGELDLQQLRMFLLLAQTGSYTETGRRLFRTQSAVSHAIRKLERSVGVPLIAHSRHPFQLTDEGKILFEACERAFAALDGAQEAIAKHRGESLGRLKLGSTVEFGYSILMNYMATFKEQHKEIELDIRLSHDLLQPLLRDELDMIIDCREHQHPSLQREVLFREDYVVVASPQFVKEHKLKTINQLEDTVIISLDDEGEWWHRFVVALPAAKRPNLTNIMAINHIRAVIVAAEKSMGVALVPRYSVLREVGEGALVTLFPEVEMFEDRFILYQKECKSHLERHQMMRDYLKSLEPPEFPKSANDNS